ncbi:calcyphosin [Thraustotheca clavata]|uniref:Calcyphosin n=1 Tax=Thraustotheca clavata TaxID=74557 RepID=A0A1W0A9S5_9STRA|nr:calcyphosin [Thraustotheca clavata]
MSTLTSADMGELKRPSTRLHAPPGGNSSWSFGDDSTPPSPPKPKAKSRLSTESAPPAPIVAKVNTVSATASTSSRIAASSRVAVLKTKSDEALVDEFVANFVKELTPEVFHEVITVPALEDLPYGANKLAINGGFDAIVCFGFLNAGDILFQAHATAITQALIQISIATIKPIVRAIFIGEPRVASVKGKAGWGAEFAHNIDGLVHLGGFISHPFQGKEIPNGNAISKSKVHVHTKSKPLSKGNDLPESFKNAPRDVTESLSALRATLYEHGARGIVGLGRKFRIMDDDGSKTLDLEEFKKAIAEHAMDLTDEEIVHLFNFFDEDKSGNISYDEFLIGLRGELNDRRKQMVLMAFEIIDANGNGIVELDDIVAKYNADQHPDVIAGRKTKNEIFREFLDTFDGGEKDGKVTPDEFIRYYANVSASIDDDDYFELMIRNAWHISGGEGWCANTTCRRVLVTHADGRQTVEEVKNDIGVSSKDTAAINANLAAQGIQAQGFETSGYVENQTKAKHDGFQPKFAKKQQHGAGESSIVFVKMREIFDTFLTDPVLLSEDVYVLWLEGQNATSALDVRLRSYGAEFDEELRDLVWRDTVDQYRLFEKLESYFIHPKLLRTQLLFQIPAWQQQEMTEKYYDVDGAVVRRLIGKKLTSKAQKDLDEVSEQSLRTLKNCRRQFENLRRIYSLLEEKNFQGNMCRAICDHFLISERLAAKYACIVFLLHGRFEVHPSHKTVGFLGWNDLQFFAALLMDHWVAPSNKRNQTTAHLTAQTNCKTISASIALLAEGSSLHCLRYRHRIQSDGGSRSRSPSRIMDSHETDWPTLSYLETKMTPMSARHCIGIDLNQRMTNALRDLKAHFLNDIETLTEYRNIIMTELQAKLQPDQLDHLGLKMLPIARGLLTIGAGLSQPKELKDLIEDLVEAAGHVFKDSKLHLEDVDLVFSALIDSLSAVDVWYLNADETRLLLLASWELFLTYLKDLNETFRSLLACVTYLPTTYKMAGYAELIARLGEKPLECLDQCEAMDEAQDNEAMYDEAANKTMHAAELLCQALSAAKQLEGERNNVSIDTVISDLIATNNAVKALAKESLAQSVKVSKGLLASAETILTPTEESQETQFQEMYMESFASAFGDELDKFRQDDTFEAKDVSYLITCVQAGANVFSPLEKELFIDSNK